MATFIETVNRIATELRRSNLTNDIKNAINDAVKEAAKTRFYFNEMHASFPTVAATEYYDDLGLVEIDAAWYTLGGVKYGIDVDSQLDINDLSVGTVTGGYPESLARYEGKIRVYPIPSNVVTIYVDGYGKLAPFPFVADGDTNAWLDAGELYIRALAKRNLLRDVIRDYGEARVYEGVAEDYKALLEADTAAKNSTGSIRSTRF